MSQEIPGGTNDALAIFGITGDLAFKKIIPAVHRLIQRGRFDGPVLGIAREGWTRERLEERVRASLREHDAQTDAGAADIVLKRLRYVGGDYRDPETFRKLKTALGTALSPLYYLAIPPSLFD